MKIGITERGDASIDTSWANKLNLCDGAIIITKNISPFVLNTLVELHQKNYPVILHATCTGWGQTPIEPNVPDYKVQLIGIKMLMDAGFPQENIVLRIDPIIPSVSGMRRVKDVIAFAKSLGFDFNKMRIRISIVDEYKHVKTRLNAMNLGTIYPGNQFQATKENFLYAENRLKEIRDEHIPGVKFYCCAEPNLTNPDLFIHAGCISQQDLQIMGLKYQTAKTNPQNRSGCLCLNCKLELLTQKHRCPHKCAYCYWRD